MPFGNGTGPAGMGPMTGRAAGYCAGYGRPGYMNPYGGRGAGYGFGRGGWGNRNRYYATGLTGRQRAWDSYPPQGPSVPYAAGYPYAPSLTREQEIDMLKSQAEYFKDTLDGIRKQIDDLEAQSQKPE